MCSHGSEMTEPPVYFVGYAASDFAGSALPRAPRINAQRGTQFDPYNTRNYLPPKKLR